MCLANIRQPGGSRRRQEFVFTKLKVLKPPNIYSVCKLGKRLSKIIRAPTKPLTVELLDTIRLAEC